MEDIVLFSKRDEGIQMSPFRLISDAFLGFLQNMHVVEGH